MKINLKIIAISFAFISTLFLSGCNTARGVGQDVQSGGQIIENAAMDK